MLVRKSIIAALPEDILTEIISYLDYNSMAQVANTCALTHYAADITPTQYDLTVKQENRRKIKRPGTYAEIRYLLNQHASRTQKETLYNELIDMEHGSIGDGQINNWGAATFFSGVATAIFIHQFGMLTLPTLLGAGLTVFCSTKSEECNENNMRKCKRLEKEIATIKALPNPRRK